MIFDRNFQYTIQAASSNNQFIKKGTMWTVTYDIGETVRSQIFFYNYMLVHVVKDHLSTRQSKWSYDYGLVLARRH